MKRLEGAKMAEINIGIDLGIKAKSRAQIRNERGEKLGHDITFSLAKKDLDNLFAQAKTYARPQDKIRIVIEATGMVWFVIALYGKLHGYEVVRVKAHKVKDLRKFYSRHRKSDRIDTQTLTMMPIVDRDNLEEVYLAPAQKQALTRRTRQREHFVEKLTAQKNRITSLIDWAFPGLLQCFADPFGNVAKMFYRYYFNPFMVQKIDPGELAETLSARSGEVVPLKVAQAIIRVAGEVCALYDGCDPYFNFEELTREIVPEVEILEVYQEQLREIEIEIERLYNVVHPEKYIETIPGVGKNLGPALYGAISDAGRFRAAKKCRAYIGYVPKEDSSGETEKKGLKMSQAGPSSARRDIYLAADIARQWDPQLAKVYYDEMVHKGRCHTQAVCAVGVRMISRVLRILKDGRNYELRDVDGHPVSKEEAKAIIEERYIVPEEIRQRTRNRKKRERFSNMCGAVPRNTPNLSRSRDNNNQRRP